MIDEIPTTERLAQALEALDDPTLSYMIRLAREGYYDDFKTPLETPQVQLYKDLLQHGHLDMARRVIDGEFDSTLAEAEEWFEAEGKHLFDKEDNS